MKPCGRQGCPNFCKSGDHYCGEHKRELSRAREDLKDESSEFYHTPAWRRLRCWFISRNPLCTLCGAAGYVVDHITPIKQGGPMLDQMNLQTLCALCHDRKRQSESSSSKLVAGRLAGGK